MKTSRKNDARAFSLIELVIVIIIMGVISAIAIPRMIKGAENADVTGLQADLSVLRSAIEMYRYEHSAFPAAASIVDQLTQETDNTGVVGAGGGYGPYVIKVPPLKTGAQKGGTTVKDITGVAPAADGTVTIGWLYDEDTGMIYANDANHLDK